MKTHVEKLQLHSAQTGLAYYDRTAPTVRAAFINQLSQIESPKKTSLELDNIPDEVVEKRRKRETTDKESILKKAKKRLWKNRRETRKS